MARITLSAPVAAILCEGAAYASRGSYGEISSVSYGGAAVSASSILADLAPSTKEAFRRTSGRYTEYRVVSLYGIDYVSQLAVISEIRGDWDSKKSRGDKSIDYVLIDLRTGNRRPVGHSKLRAEVRAEGRHPQSGVAGALGDWLDLSTDEAYDLMRRVGAVPAALAPSDSVPVAIAA